MKKLLALCSMLGVLAEDTNTVPAVLTEIGSYTNMIVVPEIPPRNCHIILGTNTYTISGITNLTTNWVSIEAVQGGYHKQVGSIQTNRALSISNSIVTNALVVEIIGIQEWPTLNRYIKVDSK